MGGLEEVHPVDVLDDDGWQPLRSQAFRRSAGFFSKDEILWQAYQAAAGCIG